MPQGSYRVQAEQIRFVLATVLLLFASETGGI